MNLDKIDINSPVVTPDYRLLLTGLKYDYTLRLSQGRGREAQLIGSALRVVWEKINSPEIDIVLPDSVFSDFR